MEIPELMIKTQARQQMDNFAQNLMSQRLTMEQYAQFTGMTADKMMEQMLPSAEKNIKTRLVLLCLYSDKLILESWNKCSGSN